MSDLYSAGDLEYLVRWRVKEPLVGSLELEGVEEVLASDAAEARKVAISKAHAKFLPSVALDMFEVIRVDLMT